MVRRRNVLLTTRWVSERASLPIERNASLTGPVAAVIARNSGRDPSKHFRSTDDETERAFASLWLAIQRRPARAV